MEELRVKRVRGTERQQALSGWRFLFSQTEDKDRDRDNLEVWEGRRVV